MIKKSLTAKLFVFVMLLFLIQVFIQYGFQKYFLADYYESQKSELSESQFKETVEAFKNAEGLMEQADTLYEYMAVTNEPILIFNEYQDYHQASYITSFEQTVTIDVGGNLLMMPYNVSSYYNLGNDIYTNSDDYNEVIEMVNPFNYELIGENVLVFGYDNENEFIANGFEYNGYIFDSVPYSETTADTIINESDKINELNTYIDGLFNDYEPVEAVGTIVNTQEKLLSSDMQKKIAFLSDYFFDISFGTVGDYPDYDIMKEQIKIEGHEYTVLSVLSLQPINEVVEIQSTFQMYLTVFMVVLIVFVSYIFSKSISKPILNISQSTAAISNLDFNVTCDEDRQDEIGTLGKSINILSRSLKDKIDTLEDEIEFERRQEKIRREFVADVSHELKTPLGVIRSYSEGIKDGISKESADDYLDVIIEEVDKMNGLVLDMLELSNLEAKQVIQKERINIKRLISNLLRSYEQLSDGLTVHVSLEDALVDVDVKMMELVISNLLSNAFRYVDDKKTINISIKDQILCIENSYEKIDDSELTKLWDRFYRLEKSRSRTFGGNGLGLSIVQKTLDLHGLKYSIENSEIGFLFKIRF